MTGKEGAAGSSPAEGSREAAGNSGFSCAWRCRRGVGEACWAVYAPH
jgi:hypothetical protein